MPRFQMLLRVGVVVVCAVLSIRGAVANDHEKELAARLAETYKPTTLNFTMTDVKTTGSVVVLQRDGIAGAPAQTIGDQTFYSPKNQFIGEDNMKQSGTGQIARTFKKGDKFYVTGFKFYSGGKFTELVVGLISVDAFPFNTVGGASVQTRYQADVAWNFSKAAIQALTVDDILDEKKGMKLNLDWAFKLESEANAVHTQSVELGQTFEQVEATLGKPGKTINLGAKTVWVYTDIKVIFVDGKVSDVQ